MFTYSILNCSAGPQVERCENFTRVLLGNNSWICWELSLSEKEIVGKFTFIIIYHITFSGFHSQQGDWSNGEKTSSNETNKMCRITTDRTRVICEDFNMNRQMADID